MVKSKKGSTKTWEVSISELQNSIGVLYKVTRHIPDMSVIETKMFRDKEKAIELFNKWFK